MKNAQGHPNLEEALVELEQLREENTKLRRLQYDKVTDLYCRAVFEEHATHLLDTASQNNKTVAYLEIDLDHFKLINDTYGHPTGDAALAHVARLLKENIRTTPSAPAYERRCGSLDEIPDIMGHTNEETVEIGRVGGEEFGIALYGPDAREAEEIAERLHNALRSTPFTAANNKPIPLTMSIGIATTETAMSWNDLYQGADQALYRAKQNGRNRTELFRAGIPCSDHYTTDAVPLHS